MNSSGKTLTVLLGALAIVTILAFLALSSVAATFAWMAGGGYGSGPILCQMATPGTSISTPATVGTPGGNSSACVKAGEVGARVVALAQAMAAALYVNPNCGGHISYPDCYYTWYKESGSTYPPGMPTFPQAVIQYGEQVCPGCSAWDNGTYDQVPFPCQGKHVLRIDVLNVTGVPHTNRIALCLYQGVRRRLVGLPLVITAPDLIRDFRADHVQQLCARRIRDIEGL